MDFIAKIDGWERGGALSSRRREKSKASEQLESVSQHDECKYEGICKLGNGMKS